MTSLNPVAFQTCVVWNLNGLLPNQMIEPGTESVVTEIARPRGERVFGALNVNRFKSRTKKERRLLIVTEVSMQFRDPKKAKKVAEPPVFWFDIQQVKFAGQNTISFIFKGVELTFQHDSVNIIVNTVLQHLRIILSDAEFSALSIDGFAIPGPSTDSSRANYRLRSKVLTSGRAIPEDLESAFQVTLMSHSSSIDLADLPCGPLFEPVLDSLSVSSFVTSVSLPAVPENTWEVAGRALVANPHIREFSTFAPINEGFVAFATLVSEKANPNLSSLSFHGPKIGLKAIKGIAGICLKQSISSLSLSSCFADSQHLRAFLDEIQSARDLRSLALDRVDELNLKTFITSLEGFEALSLTNCSIEVCPFLKGIGKLPNFKVKSVDLSGNVTDRGLGHEWVWAQSIRELTLNDLVMTRDGFMVLFRYCLTSPTMETVSIQNVGLGGTELERAITQMLARPEMQEVKRGLRALYWDQNQVTPSFCRVLELLGGLQLLSLNGSLSGADQSIRLLSEYLSHNETVTDLRVCGSAQRSLAPWQIIKLFEPFKTYNRTVARLHISSNQFDAKALDDLADTLLANRTITYVQLDVIGVADPAAWDRFFAKVQSRGAKLDIPFPTADVTKMALARAIDIPGMQKMLSFLSRIAAGSPSVDIPHESVKKLRKPTEPPSYRIDAPGAAPASQGESGKSGPSIVMTPPRGKPEKDVFALPPDEWKITFQPVPPPVPDDAAVLQQFHEAFALPKLLAALASPV
jgi:hypothetical protein